MARPTLNLSLCGGNQQKPAANFIRYQYLVPVKITDFTTFKVSKHTRLQFCRYYKQLAKVNKT